MATIGHVAAGIAIARAGRGNDTMAVFAVTLAAVAPDVDFLIGIDHRGPTHSIGFAIASGVVAVAVMRALSHPRPLLVAALASLAVGSHIVLDLLAAESPVAALWPLTDTTFVLPVRPLPSAPTDGTLLTLGGIVLALAEIAWSAALVAVSSVYQRR